LEPLLTEVSQKLNRAFGPTAAVEVTPIENWLELEAVTPLFRQHSTEWTVDLLFKKPWTLSDKKEFMLGDRPGVDSYERIWCQNEFSRSRSGS